MRLQASNPTVFAAGRRCNDFDGRVVGGGIKARLSRGQHITPYRHPAISSCISPAARHTPRAVTTHSVLRKRLARAGRLNPERVCAVILTAHVREFTMRTMLRSHPALGDPRRTPDASLPTRASTPDPLARAAGPWVSPKQPHPCVANGDDRAMRQISWSSRTCRLPHRLHRWGHRSQYLVSGAQHRRDSPQRISILRGGATKRTASARGSAHAARLREAVIRTPARSDRTHPLANHLSQMDSGFARRRRGASVTTRRFVLGARSRDAPPGRASPGRSVIDSR